MKKLASTFPNMLLSLTLICLVMGGVLGLMKFLTDKPIAKAEQESKIAALKEVLPPFDNDPLTEMQKIGLEGDGTDSVTVYKASNGGELIGYAIESYTKNGFGGKFTLMVGILADTSIKDFVILNHAETPGLGAKMQEWFRLPASSPGTIRDMRGVNLSTEMPLTVTKDGGKVDAITASTISSRAFLDAISRAYKAFQEVSSGTSKDKESKKEDSTDKNINATTKGSSQTTDEMVETANQGKNNKVEAYTAATSQHKETKNKKEVALERIN